jgi:hypothetical protein
MSGQPRCRDSTNPAAIWKSMLTRCGNGLAPVCRRITAMALQMLVQSGGLSLEIWSSGECRGCRFSELSSARSSTPATLIVSLQASMVALVCTCRFLRRIGHATTLDPSFLSRTAAQIRDWRACSTRLGITPQSRLQPFDVMRAYDLLECPQTKLATPFPVVFFCESKD